MAVVPAHAQDPEAFAIECHGPDLIEPVQRAPAAGVAGRVEDLDSSHPPAGGVEPAAIAG